MRKRLTITVEVDVEPLEDALTEARHLLTDEWGNPLRSSTDQPALIREAFFQQVLAR